MNHKQQLMDLLSKEIRDSIDSEILDLFKNIKKYKIDVYEFANLWYVSIKEFGKQEKLFHFITEVEANEFAMLEKLKYE